MLSWSNPYQLHVLMLTLRTHDIIIFGGMNGKLPSNISFRKWISRAEGEKLNIAKDRHWINYTMWSSNLFFCIQLFPAFFIVQNFQSPDFSGYRFFMVQVLLDPGFSGSRFFRVWIQGLGPGFRSSQKETPNRIYIYNIFRNINKHRV